MEAVSILAGKNFSDPLWNQNRFNFQKGQKNLINKDTEGDFHRTGDRGCNFSKKKKKSF